MGEDGRVTTGADGEALRLKAASVSRVLDKRLTPHETQLCETLDDDGKGRAGGEACMPGRVTEGVAVSLCMMWSGSGVVVYKVFCAQAKAA